jgi:toluene monooxygenase system protein E
MSSSPSGTTSTIERRRRSWSRFTEKRIPTEYEFVSHDLHWHYKPGQTPWEMAPDHVWNKWYVEYRNESAFRCSDWNQFHDPDGLVYRTYVRMQDEAETYVDALIDDIEARDGYARLDAEWVRALGEGYTTFRYVGHALLMAATYLMSMAPSSYISNAAAFQAGDELRRVQRIAYQTRQLQLHHPAQGFGEDRERWEGGPAWQPLRKVIEQLLGERDWGKAFAQLNLVVKPAVDELLNGIVAEAAAAHGDELTAMLHRNLQIDSARSGRWSAALVHTAIADQPDNGVVLQKWVDEVRGPVVDALIDVSALLSTSAHGLDPAATRARLDQVVQSALVASGLRPGSA